MAASRIISRRPTLFPRAAWVTKRSSRYTPGRPSQVGNLGWNEAKPAGSPSRKASSASNPASRWGQACRRITRGRRNRSSALGKLFVQVGLRVRIRLPPAASHTNSIIVTALRVTRKPPHDRVASTFFCASERLRGPALSSDRPHHRSASSPETPSVDAYRRQRHSTSDSRRTGSRHRGPIGGNLPGRWRGPARPFRLAGIGHR